MGKNGISPPGSSSSNETSSKDTFRVSNVVSVIVAV